MRTGNIELMLGAHIKNFRPEVFEADPSLESLVAAQSAVMWYNSTEGKYKYFDGTVIKALGDGATVEGVLKADGSVAMEADLLLSGPDQSAAQDNAAVSKKHVETVVATKQDKLSGLSENGVVIAGAGNTLQTSTVTAAELGYLSGVTSGIQTQLAAIDTKAGAAQTAAAGKVDAANGTLTGDLNAGGNTISNLAAPESPNDAARKIDIDNAIAGIDWLKDVEAVQEDGTLDPALVKGNRYLILDADTANSNFGVIAGLTDNMIVEYNGTAFVIAFDPTNPEAGGAVTWVKAIKEYRRFDTVSWTTFGGTSDFNAGSGLEKSGNVVNVKTGAGVQIVDNAVVAKLDATGGLEDNAGATRVKLDGATLSRSVDGIAVADGGIGYEQIAASALGAGLKQDTTNSKIAVDVAAVKTAGGFIDATGGDVAHINLTGTDPLTDASAVSKKYVDDAIVAAGSGKAATLHVYDKTSAGDVAAITHTFAHNSGERYGTVTVVDDTGYQIIPDEVVFVDANTLRVELTQAKKIAIAFVTGPKSNGVTEPEEPVTPEPEPEHFTVLTSTGGRITASANKTYAFLHTDTPDDIESITWSYQSTAGNLERLLTPNSTSVFCPEFGTDSIGTAMVAPSSGTITASIKLKGVTDPVVRTAAYNYTEVLSPKAYVGLRHDASTYRVADDNVKAGQSYAVALVNTTSSTSADGSDVLDDTKIIARLGLDVDDAIKSVKWELHVRSIAERATTLVSQAVITPSAKGYRANVTIPNYPDSATSSGVPSMYFIVAVVETVKGKRFIDQLALAMLVAASGTTTYPASWSGAELSAN